MKILSKFFAVLSNCIFAFYSLFWRKDSSIVLFGAWFGERFADTSRYLFQFLSGNKEKYGLTHVIWMTRKKSIIESLSRMGYEVCDLNSREAVYWHKKARYHIICNAAYDMDNIKGDILGQYSYRSVKVNLWHGVMPIKGVGLADNVNKIKKEKHPVLFSLKLRLIKKCSFYRKIVNGKGGWGDCYYLSTTPAGTCSMMKFFGLPHKNYIEHGNPRMNDEFILLEEEKQIIETIKSFKKSIIYLPTFRSKSSSFDYTVEATKIKRCLEDDILLITKPHSAGNSFDNHYGLKDNILSLNPDFDINTILKYIDALITDYSSVAADAMAYFKPIIYYVPDYEEYLRNDRGFLFEPETVMCGDVTKSVDELSVSIRKILKYNGNFTPDAKYLSVRNEYWGAKQSLEELWNYISQINR